MLTPQEVSERAFQKVSFGGYNMAQVDDFLDILTSDYSSLYNENAVLKSKMKVLVDKVEEYRSTEEAMRKALMTAQRFADEIVKEAETKKEAMLQEAEVKVQEYLAGAKQQAQAEEYRLQMARNNTAAFVKQVRNLYAEQVEFLAKLQELAPEVTKSEPVKSTVEETAAEIDDNVQRLLAKAMEEATAENLRAKVEQEDEPQDFSDTAEYAPVKTADSTNLGENMPHYEDFPMEKTSRIDFSDLQFGRDYKIT